MNTSSALPPVLTFWLRRSRTVSINTCSHLLIKVLKNSFDEHLFSPFGHGVWGQFQSTPVLTFGSRCLRTAALHLFSLFGWGVQGQLQSTPILTFWSRRSRTVSTNTCSHLLAKVSEDSFNQHLFSPFSQDVQGQFWSTPVLTFWSRCSRTVSTNTCSHLLAKMFQDSFDQHLFSPFGRGVQGQFQCSCAAWWVPQLALDQCLWWSRSSHIPAGCTGQWTENPNQTLLAYRLQWRSSQQRMTMSKTSKVSK